MERGQEDGLSLTAVDQYLRQVKQIPPLCDDEEAQLLLCIASGVDIQQAQSRLVEGYQQVVVKLARRFARDCCHLDWLDLVQEGSLGLLRAIEKYDANMAVASFKTLAFAWIRGAMLMAYWRCERAIRLPLNKVRAIRRMNEVSVQLMALLGHEPTVREIAQAMELHERDVQELAALQDQQIVSLHTPLEDGETLLEEVLEDDAASASAADGFFSADDVLDKLTEREQAIMRLRYGLVDGHAYTQKEVAERLGVASSRVAVLEHRAKMRLRQALASYAG
jgi:RNA polymerase primary sigma factor